MKNFFIVPNPSKDLGYKITEKVCNLLKAHGASIYMPCDCKDSLIDAEYTCDFPKAAELIIVLGGDGSIIDASHYAIDNDCPILGVNLGKVGYLGEVEPSDLTTLEKIFSDEYKIVEKMLLSASVEDENKHIELERLAVNDIIITPAKHLGIADFVVYSHEGGVRYRGDGVVLATPAGSTAYSLSAGGPIVSQKADAIIVTPIAPHSFFNRSIIFGTDEKLRVKNHSPYDLNVSIDGRFLTSMAPGEKCIVQTSDKKIKVLTFKENNTFSNLFTKMQLVEDVI